MIVKSKLLALTLLIIFNSCSIDKKLKSAKFQKTFIEQYIEQITKKETIFSSYNQRLTATNPLRSYDWFPDVYQEVQSGFLIINEEDKLPERHIEGKNGYLTTPDLLYDMQKDENHFRISPVYFKSTGSGNTYTVFEEFISCTNDSSDVKEFLYLVTQRIYRKEGLKKLKYIKDESQEFYGGKFFLPKRK